MFTKIILVTLASTGITFILTPIMIIVAKKLQLVDNPKTRPHPAHTHTGIIPRGGGVPIFLGIFIPFLFLLPLARVTICLLVGAAILTLVGLFDDKKGRSPYIRFFINCLVAILTISVGINIPYITNPFGGVVNLENLQVSFNLLNSHLILTLASIIGFIWIVWTTNVIGWSGGVDGQLPGFVFISSLVIGILSLRYATSDPKQLHVTLLSFATSGAFLGFLPWNFYPQKIMPGYGGKTLAGYLLGVLSILSFSKLGTALLVLAVPILDGAFMLVRRILSGKSPVWASSGHLHHHLLSLGWGRRKIALFYWLVSAIAGIAALTLNSRQKMFVGVLVLCLVFGFILWINLLKNLLKGEAALKDYSEGKVKD